jgi:hypothetical protein
MVLPEPKMRALIACQIQSGPERTWINRTYEVIRTDDDQWRIDFGEGGLEPRRSWSDVLEWLWHLAPRDVEMMEIEP